MVHAPRADVRQRRGGRSAPTAVPARARRPPVRPGDWPRAWPPARVSACSAAGTRASTTACASTWSTASCRSATSCWPEARWPPCLVIEAVTRLLPGVMGNASSPQTESFGATGLLEEPQFTRPAEFRGWAVPEVLRSGDHAPDRPVAAGAGAAPHGALPAGPGRGPRRADRRGPPAVGRVPRRPLSLSVPHPACCSEGRAMKPTDLVDQQHLRDRHPVLRSRRRGEGPRAGRRGQPGAGPGLPGQRDRPLRRRRCRRPSRSARSASGRRRADLPAALADHPKLEVVTPGRRSPGQALLPAGAHREGREDQGEARGLTLASTERERPVERRRPRELRGRTRAATRPGVPGRRRACSATRWRPSAASTWRTRELQGRVRRTPSARRAGAHATPGCGTCTAARRFVPSVRVLTFKDVNVEELPKVEL